MKPSMPSVGLKSLAAKRAERSMHRPCYPEPVGVAQVRSVEVNIGVKENRWKLIKALLLYPKATHIRMTIPAASVFIAPAQDNDRSERP